MLVIHSTFEWKHLESFFSKRFNVPDYITELNAVFLPLPFSREQNLCSSAVIT